MPHDRSTWPVLNGATVSEPSEVRRWPPASLRFVLAIGAVAIVMSVLIRQSDPTPIACTDQLAADRDTVVMLSASWCGYCRRARAFLHAEGITHCEFDIETTARGRELFARAPAKVIPILTLRGRTLVGFDGTAIKRILAAHGITGSAD